MANDKKFVVKNGLQANNVAFVNESNSATVITASMLSSDVLSFSGNSGQLFSISDTMSGVIFAVNDISGVPSIEVDDTGDIRLAELSGNVSIGTSLDTHKLYVQGNTYVNGSLLVGGTVINSTVYSGTANNATYLNGQLASYYTNATNITTGTLPYAQIPANVINTTAAFTRTGITTFSANVVLGSSGLSANASFGTAGHVLHSNGTATYWAADDQGVTSVASGNGISGGTITSTGTLYATGGSTLTINTAGIHVNSSLSITDLTLSGNATIGPRATLKFANTSIGGIPTIYTEAAGNTAASPTQTTTGSVLFSIQPTAYTGTAYTGGAKIEAVATENITSATRGTKWVLNAINAGGFTSSPMEWDGSNLTLNTVNVATQTFSSNATNLTTGTIPYARIPANIVNTSAAFTLSGVTTHAANVILGSVGLSANGGFGTAGHVLHSNGTATYWAADDQGVTSVATANGLSGGTITSTGTIGVVTGPTLVVNNSGIHVNSTLSITDLTVAGNLTVSGTTTYINTTTLNVGDSLITLNADLANTVAPSENSGIEVNRGNAANVQFYWDETDDRWTTNGQSMAVSSLVVGNSSVSTTVNSTAFTGTANNSTNFGGLSLATVQSQITGNAATAYTNATTYASNASNISSGTLAFARLPTVDSVANTSVALVPTANNVKTAYDAAITANTNAATALTAAGSAYTNATTYASNASNISSGTLAFARLPALYLGTTAIQSTSAAQAVSGITTLAAGNTTITGFANVTTTLQVGTNTATFGTAAYIVANGNLGVGTSTPIRPAHFYYNSAAVGAYTAVLQGATGGYGAGVSFQSVLTGGALAEMARITADGESSWNTTASTQYAGLRFYTARSGTITEAMRLNGDGRLIVGTTSPINTNMISAYGANQNGFVAQVSNNAYSLYQGFNSSATLTYQVDGPGNGYFAGNLGVGTSSPANKLHIAGSAGTLLRLDGGAGGTGTRDIFISEFDTTAYGGIIRYDSGADTFTFGTVENSTVVKAINVLRTSGNVGIGNTAPAHKLSVNGTGYFSDDLTVNGGQVFTAATQARVKLSVWDSTGYGIGMQSGYTYGGITNDYVMSFQMSDSGTGRGFWWGDAGHTNAQGAMALTTDGKLTVATAARIGFGESDTTVPGSTYALEVNGAFAATTKSFLIDHPTKEGMKLRYGSLEGPENGVYVRGRLRGSNIIELPDYWTGLVDEDTITVNLTAVGKSQNLYVAYMGDGFIRVENETDTNIDCFYTVFAERKDVEKLEVEF